MRTKTRTYTATGLLALTLGISATACSSSAEAPTEPATTSSPGAEGPMAATTSSASPTPTRVVTPSPSPPASASTAAPTTEPAPPSTPPAPSEEKARIDHPYGPFLQVPLPEDNKAYDVAGPSFVSTPDLGRIFPTDVFTPEQIASAQRTVSDFIASEGVNSVLNNSAALPPQELAALRDTWWGEHKSLFAPDQREAIELNLSGESPVMEMEPWQKDSPTYRYLYGENEPRVQDRTIRTQQVWAGPGQNLTFVVAVAYTADVLLDGAAMPFPQMSYGNMSYTVVPDGNDTWLISDYGVGVSVDMTTVPASTTSSPERTEAEQFVEALTRTTPA